MSARGCDRFGFRTSSVGVPGYRAAAGTWRTTATSVPHRAPVIGKGADANTISEYTSEWPLCVEPGDRIGLVSVGGFDARLFPNGLPYQVFGRWPGRGAKLRARAVIAASGSTTSRPVTIRVPRGA